MQKTFYVTATLVMLTTCFMLLMPSRVNAATISPTLNAGPATTVAPATTAAATPNAGPATTVAPVTTAAPTATVQRMVTLWLQAADSCERGLPGASFSLVNSTGQAMVAPLTRGAGPATIGKTHGACPMTRGNCARQAIGCTRWRIPVPATGSVTYRIVENATRVRANGITFTENPTAPDGSALGGFEACNGGSACHSESAVVTVSSSGSISAVVRNMAPDTTVQTYGPFTGMVTDPVLFHNYGVGYDYKSDPCVASKGNVQMNYGTGSQSQHCMYVP